MEPAFREACGSTTSDMIGSWFRLAANSFMGSGNNLHFNEYIQYILGGIMFSFPATCGDGDMIGNWFLFSGRIGRLKFFLASFVFAPLAMLVIFSITTLTAVFVLHIDGSKKAGLLVAIPTLIIFIWVFYSLQAARFRDIGWNPLLVFPALLAFYLVDFSLAYAFPVLGPAGGHYTYASTALNFVITAALLFTPSCDNDSIPSILLPDIRLPGRGFFRKGRASAKPNKQRQVSGNVVRQPVAQARTSFGRLGLD